MKSKSIESWDSHYAQKSKGRIIEVFAQRYTSRIFEKHFTKSIKKRGILLEPGCGSGQISSLYSKNGETVCFLDFTLGALNMAARNYYKFNKRKFMGVRADIFNMPFKDGSFQITWNQGVLEHFDEPKIALEEMVRVTKPEGNVVISVPAFLSILHIIYASLNKIGIPEKWPFGAQKFFKKSELRKIMKEAGCQNVIVARPLSLFYLSIVAVSEKV